MSETSYFSSDSEDEERREVVLLDDNLAEKLAEVSLENKIQNIQGASTSNGISSSITKSDSFHSGVSDKQSLSSASINNLDDPEIGDSEDFMHQTEWLNERTHLFILSSAGKPIYSLHGCEDKLATLFGLLQALVSVVQTNDDQLKSLYVNGQTFVFLIKNPLILVGVSKTKRSAHQIQMQLLDVYNQILSIVTLSSINSIYEKRKNYDLRKLLAGSERLIDHLLSSERTKKVSNDPFVFLTHSVKILPLESSVRDSITNVIQSNCSKIKNLVFAVLIMDNRLVTLVRMKNYFMHTDDLRLIFNLIDCNESFKQCESWTPLCLPKFDPNGFLHTHISYLSDDCMTCLLLLSVDSDGFYALSEAKKKITDVSILYQKISFLAKLLPEFQKLRRSNAFEAIKEAAKEKGPNMKSIVVPEIRHFLYKNKKNAQLLCSELTVPYNTYRKYRN